MGLAAAAIKYSTTAHGQPMSRNVECPPFDPVYFRIGSSPAETNSLEHSFGLAIRFNVSSR